MSIQFYTIITSVGATKIANSVATGTKISLTTLKVGDSNGSYYEPSASQTDIVNKVYECDINNVEIDSGNTNDIVITSSIPADIGGFTIREAGIFDSAGDMIAIAKYPESYKPIYTDGSTKEFYLKTIIAVSNSSAVELTVDPTVVLATKEEIDEINSSLYLNTQQINGKHYLTYKSVAGTIASVSQTITDEQISACERMGTDMCVCVMVSVTSDTDSTIVKLDNSIVTATLDRVKASTVKPIMIKPHIGLNYSDGYNRKYYLPTDIPTFFTNWTNTMLNYASICNTYNIPILCVSCEMVQLTVNAYSSYWETLYNTIKTAYPNLQIIHAPKVWEFNDDGHEDSLQWADILGCTLYLHYTPKSFVGDTVDSYEDVGKSFYYNEYDFIKTMNERCYKYNKKFYIVEIGCMAIQDGLIDVVPQSYNNGTSITNYYVQSSLMEGFFKYLCNSPNIIGFSWWHIGAPFAIYSPTETLPSETMMTNYLKGGLI